ncbi:MAG: NAD(P)-dependent oxidoreductase [Firmicutes bacterium]|nr:NAD(P)-dependent oxidoreductase [Bacillota bacterium]
MYQRLLELESKRSPIVVGVIGAGQMGAGLVVQLETMPGMRSAVVADIVAERARDSLLMAGVTPGDVVVTDDLEEASRALSSGKRVATRRGTLVAGCPNLDVVVDCTGDPNSGAEVALEAITARKHVVLLTVETDVTVGPVLNRLARAAGVVYTVASGDEPGVIMDLYNHFKALGFSVLVAGKGKNNPLDRSANPSTCADEAGARAMNAKMLAAFVDGTKTMVEMAAVANATGLVPDVRSMHGPNADLDRLLEVFELKPRGGALNRFGVVDYTVGNVAPGVFVIASIENEKVRQDLGYLKMGSGPNYLFYRPFHLANIETPISIAKAVLLREATIAPSSGLVAECMTVAKKDLAPGEEIDGIGGYTVYGSVDTAEAARAEGALPLGLARGAVLKRTVRKGELVRYDDVIPRDDTVIWSLRRLQDLIDWKTVS